MAKWLDIGPASDFPADTHECVDAGGYRLVIFHVAGQFLALANVCPHAGLPLGEGERHDSTITCPFHGYTFDIHTGRNIDLPDDEFPVRSYPARLSAGRVQVDVADPPSSPEGSSQ